MVGFNVDGLGCCERTFGWLLLGLYLSYVLSLEGLVEGDRECGVCIGTVRERVEFLPVSSRHEGL